MGDLAGAVRYVNELAELALREAERRCRQSSRDGPRAEPMPVETTARGERGRDNLGWTCGACRRGLPTG